MSAQYKKGMVFGVFDGLHEGHRHFLKEAAARCDTLGVVVAQEGSARSLKGHQPIRSLEERMEAIASFAPSFIVIAGDEISGSWKVLENFLPDVAILGYDQEAIATELDTHAVPYIYLTAHKPERFKSSILDTRQI